MVITKYIDVEAWDEEQAKNIADKSNVGDFKESLVPHVFNMKKVEKL